MKYPLFKRTGILFLPQSLLGWLIALAALAFSVYLFIDIDSRSHSVSDTLMNFAFNLLVVGVMYFSIAAMLSVPLQKKESQN